MMKRTLLVLLLAGSGLVVNVPPVRAVVDNAGAAYRASTRSIGSMAPETNFAQSIDDLPLMEGLRVIAEDDVLFIFGSDRIAQTTVKGQVDIDSVYYYYQKTLPQLGWMEITPRLYERNGEQLHLDASSANNEGMTYVRFSVEPTAGPVRPF